MRFITTVFRWIGNFLLLLGLVVVLACAGLAINRQMELGYSTKVNWKWQDWWHRIQHQIQARADGTNVTFLRRVYPDAGYSVYASLQDDYSRSVWVFFDAKCAANSEVVTSAEWDDGTPKKLICNDEGTALFHAAGFSEPEQCDIWSVDLDGFSVNESFCDWDFTRARQEVTLRKAAIPQPVVTEPTITEPAVTEPVITAPVIAEPADFDAEELSVLPESSADS